MSFFYLLQNAYLNFFFVFTERHFQSSCTENYVEEYHLQHFQERITNEDSLMWLVIFHLLSTLLSRMQTEDRKIKMKYRLVKFERIWNVKSFYWPQKTNTQITAVMFWRIGKTSSRQKMCLRICSYLTLKYLSFYGKVVCFKPAERANSRSGSPHIVRS